MGLIGLDLVCSTGCRGCSRGKDDGRFGLGLLLILAEDAPDNFAMIHRYLLPQE